MLSMVKMIKDQKKNKKKWGDMETILQIERGFFELLSKEKKN